MPESGDLKLAPGARSSAFSHAEEKTSPYSYAVTLDDYRIHARITGTTRAGLLSFRVLIMETVVLPYTGPRSKHAR